MGKTKTPAKPRLTKAKKDEILDHVRHGMRVGAAAEALGFARGQVYELITDDEEFAGKLEKAEREATEHVEEALYQAAVSGNVTAARIWLERSEPKKSTALVPAGEQAQEPGFDQELAELNAIAAGDD